MIKTKRIAWVLLLSLATSPVSAQLLPQGWIPNSPSSDIENVQALDPSLRIVQLEEQVRQLTGRLEELGFQMLQMQEQMRQMQQDNEFRFQDLEDAAGNDQSSIAPKTDRTNEANGDVQLGAVQFDANGNVIDNSVSGSVNSDEANEIYKAGYGHILAGNYPSASQSFQNYLDRFPNGPQAADAQFWLGEALYSQGEYKDAASVFLDAHKAFPDAAKAPDTLLKLGMALVALDNRETACVTYDEVLVRYPQSSKAVKDKVASEKSRARC